jgi:hypothetical protein
LLGLLKLEQIILQAASEATSHLKELQRTKDIVKQRKAICVQLSMGQALNY